MAIWEISGKPKSPEARAEFRGFLRSILKAANLRAHIRLAAISIVILLFLTIFIFLFSFRHFVTIHLLFISQDENLLSATIRDHQVRNLYLSLLLSSQTKLRGPDRIRAHGYLDRAEEQHPSPYGSYLRASLLARELGSDWANPDPIKKVGIDRFYQAIQRGSRFDPENLFWPLLQGEAKAMEGKGGEALDLLLQGSRGKERFSFPPPEGPYREFISIAEKYSTNELPFYLARNIHILTEQILANRENETPDRLAKYHEFSSRLGKAALMRFQDGNDPIRGQPLLLVVKEALESEALLVHSLPGRFSTEDVERAEDNAAMGMALFRNFPTRLLGTYFRHLSVMSWMPLCFSGLFLLVCLVILVVSRLKNCRPTVLQWILVQDDLKRIHWTIAVALSLGAVICLSFKRVYPFKENWPLPNLILFLAFSGLALILLILDERRSKRISRMQKKAGSGVWNIQSRYFPLSPTLLKGGILLFFSNLSVILSPLIVDPPHIDKPAKFLLYPEKAVVSTLAGRDREFVREHSKRFSTILREN